jgi:hypothetical protein
MMIVDNPESINSCFTTLMGMIVPVQDCPALLFLFLKNYQPSEGGHLFGGQRDIDSYLPLIKTALSKTLSTLTYV